jgi:hypothetical protein
MYEYLKNDKEPIPSWLLEIKEGDKFSRDDFFSSRIVFYPGSYTDGHAVKVFGSTHAAHSFVYVDYLISQEELESELVQHAFLGYENLFSIQLSANDLAPYGWTPTIHFTPSYPFNAADKMREVYSFLQILERKPEYDEEHGPKRLAILFLFADGIATYDALFCQARNKSEPFAVLLQDHGFGGNYDKFGMGGLMERIALHTQIKPTYLLVSEDTMPWRDYIKIENIQPDQGGMYNTTRYLYKKNKI